LGSPHVDINSTPRSMFVIKERTDAVKPKLVTFRVQRNFPPTNWNPPLAPYVDLTFQEPGFTCLFERLRSKVWSIDELGQGVNSLLSERATRKELLKDSLTKSNFRHSWKPVQHYKCWVDTGVNIANDRLEFQWGCLSGTAIGSYISDRLGKNAPRLLVTDHPTFRSAFGTFGSHNLDLPIIMQDTPDDGFVPKPVGLAVLTEYALKGMLPHIKEEMSLVNSVIELRDFKSLPETLRRIGRLSKFLAREFVFGPKRLFPSIVKDIPTFKVRHVNYRLTDSIISRVRSHFKHVFGPTLREMFQASADGYLQAEFNVLPLLRDMQTLWVSLVKLDKRFSRLISEQGRRQKKHYNFEWQEPESPALYIKTVSYALNLNQFAGSINPPGFTGCERGHLLGFQVTRRVTHYQPTKYHAQVEFNYHFTRFQNENAQLLYFLDVVGVHLNPAIIWNAIPWSFLVDWVIGVSRWLGDRKSLNMEPVVNISRFLWSIEYHRRIRTSFQTYQKGYDIPVTLETYLPDMYESTYRRDVTLPSRSAAIFGSGLNSSELSLGAALAITRKRRQYIHG